MLGVNMMSTLLNYVVVYKKIKNEVFLADFKFRSAYVTF